MKNYNRRIASAQKRLAFAYTSSVVLASVVLILILVFAHKAYADPNQLSTPLWFTIPLNILLGIIGAAIVLLLFSWITRDQTVNSIEAVVRNTLAETLQPYRQKTLEGARQYDRYDCWLGTNDALKDGGYDEYVNQVITRSFTIDNLPSELRAIFAVGNKDKVLADYFDNPAYIVNYKIECRDDELDVKESLVCNFHRLSVNGEVLVEKRRKILTVNGCQAKEIVFSIPEHLRQQPTEISFTFHILKWVGYNSRFQIPSQVFDISEEVEYRLYLDETIMAKELIIDTTEISSLGRARPIISHVVQDGNSRPVGAHILIRSPVQSGSAIRFDIQRDTPMDMGRRPLVKNITENKGLLRKLRKRIKNGNNT
jgi:hypothetical protein